MSCNCTNTNPNACPSSQSCLCGIVLDIYDENGVLIKSLDSGGYLEPVNNLRFYFLDTTIFPVIPEEGGSVYFEKNAGVWNLWYQIDGDSIPFIVYSLGIGGDCPISDCDWVFEEPSCKCLTVSYIDGEDEKTYNLGIIGVTDGKDRFYFQNDDVTIDVYWSSASSQWVMSINGFIYTNSSEDDCPVFDVWTPEDVENPFEPSTSSCNPTKYILKTRAIECGCCDEKVLLTIFHTQIGEEVSVYGNVVKDEYGNILGVNGKQYYMFILNINGVDETYYLYFSGTNWQIGANCDNYYRVTEDGQPRITEDLNHRIID